MAAGSSNKETDLAMELSGRLVEFWGAIKSSDRKRANGLCARKSTFFSANEGFEPDFAGHLSSQACAMSVIDFKISIEGAVRMSDDVAVVAYTQQFQGTVKDAKKQTAGRSTVVFLREEGSWKIGHMHETCVSN